MPTKLLTNCPLNNHELSRISKDLSSVTWKGRRYGDNLTSALLTYAYLRDEYFVLRTDLPRKLCTL